MDYTLPEVHAWHNRLDVPSVIAILQRDFPGDPACGGVFPGCATWVDTANMLAEDYAATSLGGDYVKPEGY